ncbi:hypothetical protein AAG570_008905 [Ranatra chinensis]|uniref:SUEL-type lectin domain-containing protein n=1 Tax=Ranatra chinensis TaxID=642074 RepID=A0ABD0YS81_9HEMI
MTWRQYSLLQTVVEACQKKRACKFHTSPKSFGGDPCPGVRKYVEVAYKCRPYEFRSKVACENDVVQLKCNPNSRIAIYSSSYGRTEYESVQCPQPQGVPEETCLVSYATETVMQICHGKRRCSLSADSATFGNPCRKESRMYLKVVYTCVPRKVLREQYEDRPEEDEMVEPEMDFDQYDSLDDAFRDSDAFSPSPNLAGGGRHNASARPHLPSTAVPTPYSNPNNETLHGGKLKMTNPQRPVQKPRVFPNEIQRDSETDAGPTINCTITIYTNGKTRVIGFISEWINAYNFLSQNTERLYLYLMLSVGGGLLSLMSLVIARLLWQRHMLRRRTKYEASAQGATALPNGFTDDISEVDADIDLTTVASPVMATGIIHQVPGEVDILELILFIHSQTIFPIQRTTKRF